MRMSQILHEAFPEHPIAVLSGPNLAVEIAQGLPTATVIASDDMDCAASLQGVLGSPRFRIYTSRDVVSVELGGALKNVFAIAAGISDGLGLGDNSKAALVIRSLAELVRLGAAMGGSVNAFYGLSGAGDLVLTCYSERSRNHTVGKRLGRGEPMDQITASMKTVAEGIPTTRSAWECARRLNIVTPIIDQVYAVIYLLLHKVHRTARRSFAGCESLFPRCKSGKFWQKRRMYVDDAAGERIEHGRV